MGRNKKNLTGRRFGRLTVIEEAGRDKWCNMIWLCKCDCGNEVEVISGNLTSGRTK